jgi:hypothetical protein
MPNRDRISDLDQKLRSRLASAFRQARLSRVEVAEKLSPLVNREITVSTLNDYTTMKERVRFPAAYIVPLCEVLDSDPLESLVLRPRRYRLLLLGECIAQILDDGIQEILLANTKKGRAR